MDFKCSRVQSELGIKDGLNEEQLQSPRCIDRLIVKKNKMNNMLQHLYCCYFTYESYSNSEHNNIEDLFTIITSLRNVIKHSDMYSVTVVSPLLHQAYCKLTYRLTLQHELLQHACSVKALYADSTTGDNNVQENSSPTVYFMGR